MNHPMKNQQSEESIEEMLDRLANFEAMIDALRLQKEAEIEKIFTPEIKAEIEAIEFEFSEKAEGARENIAKLKEEIKARVIERGETVNGKFYQARYSKGKTTWDGKLLEGYAIAHPELSKLKKTGSPSVAFHKR